MGWVWFESKIVPNASGEGMKGTQEIGHDAHLLAFHLSSWCCAARDEARASLVESEEIEACVNHAAATCVA